ncbi:hypothetical protein [Aneurinibacillus tyrosinisolvens]|jgi:hypothetical protein|uniref:hypothetical protein n=1 Tax=Aneurinibacillus tyrosinisolvens TaxID=1443435 RepID=UPI00063F4AE2|nr:hypothetical protein [Aneurinibacillus tyrosinisolvens]
MKPIEYLMTPKVDDTFDSDAIEAIISKATEIFETDPDKYYWLAVESTDEGCAIKDENGNVCGTLSVNIPEAMWILTEEQEEQYLFMALLPEEYEEDPDVE